jgi:hypothetical protein
VILNIAAGSGPRHGNGRAAGDVHDMSRRMAGVMLLFGQSFERRVPGHYEIP